MSAPRDEREPHDDLDRLLRESLPDDLPADVEARMAGRMRAFLFSKRAEARAGGRAPGLVDRLVSRFAGWAPARLALAVATALLLVSGLGLQAVAAAGAAGEPLRRIQLSVALFRALQGASSLRCTGMSDAALESPGALAESVYRRWVPVRASAQPSGDVVASYRSVRPVADYELVLDGATLLPREVRRRNGAASEATCTWTTGEPSR
jgi:hypothetical protein